jgi:hypothetical protein
MTTADLGTGTAADPWRLQTPPLSSTFEAWRDDTADPPQLVVQVGATRLAYQWRGIADCHAMLAAAGDWVPLGNADEGKPVTPGTVEAWARDPANPVGGWYGLRKGYRGRFANYVTPVMERLGLVDLEHGTRNNRVRAR